MQVHLVNAELASAPPSEDVLYWRELVIASMADVRREIEKLKHQQQLCTDMSGWASELGDQYFLDQGIYFKNRAEYLDDEITTLETLHRTTMEDPDFK